MKVRHFKNGTSRVTFDIHKRCVCGCGEGIHVVAAMARRKCCDACTGEFRPVDKPHTPGKGCWCGCKAQKRIEAALDEGAPVAVGTVVGESKRRVRRRS